jgi:hypothetical protein
VSRPLTLAALVATLLGCGGAPAARPTEPPRETLRAYAEALARGDVHAAYALEAETAHRGRDVAAHAERLEDARAELAEVGRAIAAATDAALRAHARIPLESGEVVVLARDPDGAWRFEGGTLGAPALAAPPDALAALRSALVRRDLRAIEELLARATRATWEDEVRRVIEALEDPDALRVVVNGERATATTPDGGTIELVREAEEWRIVDIDPGPAP